MKLLCILLSCISGLMLLAAAFVYLVDSKRGQHILQRSFQQLRMLFFVLFALYAAAALVSAVDSVSVIAGVLTMSVVAYLVRECRRPKRELQPGSGAAAERTPVVPISRRRANGNDAGGGR